MKDFILLKTSSLEEIIHLFPEFSVISSTMVLNSLIDIGLLLIHSFLILFLIITIIFSATFSWREYGVMLMHFILNFFISSAESLQVWREALSSIMIEILRPFSLLITRFQTSSINQQKTIESIEPVQAFTPSIPLSENAITKFIFQES